MEGVFISINNIMGNIKVNGNLYLNTSPGLWQDPFNNRQYSASAMDIIKRFPNGYFKSGHSSWNTTEIWAASEYPTDRNSELYKPENMGDVNKYVYVKPMVWFSKCDDNGGFHADYPPLGSQGATGLVNVNCFTPYDTGQNGRLRAIRDRLNELPEGKKCVYGMRYNQGRMFDQSITIAGATYWDKFSNGATGSLWAESIGLTLSNDANILFAKLKELGGEIDYICFDMEQIGYLMAKYNSVDANSVFDARVNGITLSSQYNQPFYGSPSFSSIISEYNQFNYADILNGVSNNLTNPSYLYWNRAVFSINSAWINEFILKPIKNSYPDVKCSNYDMFDGSTANYVYDLAFHEMKPLGIVGDAATPVLYIGNSDNVQDFGILASDPTRIVLKGTPGFSTVAGFTGDSWNHFLIGVQNIRSVKRQNYQRPIRPWVAAINYINNNLSWLSNASSIALYYEMIRHIALTGTELFYYFSYNDTYNTYTPKLDDVLNEINQQIGGYRNNSLVTAKLSFLDLYVISGVQCNTNTFKWRVTPKPGTSIYYQGNLLSLDTDNGVWITTDTQTVPTITTS